MNKKLRIGFDARLYTQTGVGRYIRNLLGQFKKLDGENEYYIFLRSEDFIAFKTEDERWHKQVLEAKWHSLKEQITVPSILARFNLDVMHFPYFNIPIFYRGKFLLTVHDLIIDHFDTGRASTLPSSLYKMKRLGYKAVVSQAMRRSSLIAAISRSTKKEVMEHYHIRSDKIKVTYDALDENFLGNVKKQKPDAVYKYPYLLYVGNAYPHKNLERLISAFGKYFKGRELKLILVGGDDFFYSRLKQFVSNLGLAQQIIFYGKADDKELVNLYSNARLFVFPSLMEGFGLPNLEALVCGCLPVVSDIPVFREIWQDKLIYFNPHDIDSIGQVILSALEVNSSDYNKQVEKAKAIVDKFRWLDTARKTLILYSSIS